MGFEMKKAWRQKKFVWLLLVVLVGVSGVFSQNYSERESMKERALGTIQPHSEEVDTRYHFYKERVYKDELDEAMRKQKEIYWGFLFHVHSSFIAACC